MFSLASLFLQDYSAFFFPNYDYVSVNYPALLLARLFLSKRAPDLAWFRKYSLFGPFCFVSFFKFCLRPGELTILRGPALIFSFVLFFNCRQQQLSKTKNKIKSENSKDSTSFLGFLVTISADNNDVDCRIYICKVMKTKSVFLLRDLWSSILEQITSSWQSQGKRRVRH